MGLAAIWLLISRGVQPWQLYVAGAAFAASAIAFSSFRQTLTTAEGQRVSTRWIGVAVVGAFWPLLLSGNVLVWLYGGLSLHRGVDKINAQVARYFAARGVHANVELGEDGNYNQIVRPMVDEDDVPPVLQPEDANRKVSEH